MMDMRQNRANDPQAGLGEVQPDSSPDKDDPYLLTPGPLTTSRRTKEAMLHDWGSWDAEFNEVTADIRRRLIAMAGGGGASNSEAVGQKKVAYDCVPLQGSGTYCVEAMLSSFIPKDGWALVLINGALERFSQTPLLIKTTPICSPRVR